jgi:hypothetical protein
MNYFTRARDHAKREDDYRVKGGLAWVVQVVTLIVDSNVTVLFGTISATG